MYKLRKTTLYVYQGQSILYEETFDTTNWSLLDSNKEKRELNVDLGGKNVAKYKWTSTTGWNPGDADIFYHLLDHLGSRQVVVDSIGDEETDVEYETFGDHLGGTAEEYSYTGKQRDSVTGLSYFNARFYDPEIGRFITVDPIRDGMNWYVYCRNNPLKFIDKTGLFAAHTTREDCENYYDDYTNRNTSTGWFSFNNNPNSNLDAYDLHKNMAKNSKTYRDILQAIFDDITDILARSPNGKITISLVGGKGAGSIDIATRTQISINYNLSYYFAGIILGHELSHVAFNFNPSLGPYINVLSMELYAKYCEVAMGKDLIANGITLDNNTLDQIKMYDNSIENFYNFWYNGYWILYYFDEIGPPYWWDPEI